ncbi:MAG: PadR family transcriptional regulator [Clostridiales bacterium]|nr:PadR family transcriptional regulator [Clostridiales bacterium]
MSITSDLIRGHTETIILAHLCHGESYGYKINKAIQEKSGGRYELKEATLYGAFRRLEEGGYISSYWGDENTGARRRYYSITPLGREFFKVSCKEWETAKILIDTLIETEVRDDE